MELQKTKHQMKLTQWGQLVYECRNSGLTVKEWCAKNEINVGTYYRWQKKVCESGAQRAAISPVIIGRTTFAEYIPASHTAATGTAVTLTIGQTRLEIQNGASTETIEATIQAISRLC